MAWLWLAAPLTLALWIHLPSLSYDVLNRDDVTHHSSLRVRRNALQPCLNRLGRAPLAVVGCRRCVLA